MCTLGLCSCRRMLAEPRLVCLALIEPAVLPCMWAYMRNGVVLLPGLCTFDVCWPSLGLYAFDVNRTDLGILFAMCYGSAALCVGLDVQSRVVLLPGSWSCWLCVYPLSLRLCLVGVLLPQVVRALSTQVTRNVISVCTLPCGTDVTV